MAQEFAGSRCRRVPHSCSTHLATQPCTHSLLDVCPLLPLLQPPTLGQAQQPSAPSAQLQLLQQLQMAAAAAGGGQGGMPGAAPGMGGNPGMQPGGQPGGGMTAAQQQQLLGMLRMSSGRQQQ